MPRNSYGMSLEDMFNQLNADGVSIVIYSPAFFSKTSTNWNLSLKKSDNGVRLEIEETDPDLLVVMRRAYDKWHSSLDGKLSQHLGAPQIEHKKEEQDIRHPSVPGDPFDNEIPF